MATPFGVCAIFSEARGTDMGFGRSWLHAQYVEFEHLMCQMNGNKQKIGSQPHSWPTHMHIK